MLIQYAINFLKKIYNNEEFNRIKDKGDEWLLFNRMANRSQIYLNSIKLIKRTNMFRIQFRYVKNKGYIEKVITKADGKTFLKLMILFKGAVKKYDAYLRSKPDRD